MALAVCLWTATREAGGIVQKSPLKWDQKKGNSVHAN